ncbi:MAG: hypothetical protein WB798_00330, partial [Nocardioidaceae bacterium]
LSAEQAAAAAERLDEPEAGPDAGPDNGTGSDTAGLTAGLLRLHADRTRIVARETRLRQRFTTAHPHVPTTVVPALSTDVHDLDGLRLVGDLLSRRV